MKIQILKKDIEADTYTYPSDCAIARALKRIMPSAIISVGPEDVKINDQYFLINPVDYIKLNSMYASLDEDGWGFHTKDCGSTPPKNFILELMESNEETYYLHRT